MKSFEAIEVSMTEVACDGGGGPLGHPKVYLHMDSETGEIMCPYCSRTYLFRPQSMRRPAGNH